MAPIEPCHLHLISMPLWTLPTLSLSASRSSITVSTWDVCAPFVPRSLSYDSGSRCKSHCCLAAVLQLGQHLAKNFRIYQYNNSNIFHLPFFNLRVHPLNKSLPATSLLYKYTTDLRSGTRVHYLFYICLVWFSIRSCLISSEQRNFFGELLKTQISFNLSGAISATLCGW